ncbi:thiamine phosphate synthase [Paenibacillus macerans]|uniref:thiamine phosphate synthase n=1 Tax=Paenibacillus macerans TaxID=44252 RepID=UPI00203E148F|nr:thiamine phosphate synthase [Paenibacillus macerans]MCM3698150.1 thiamine phosphate synthase [Paenibacillus macerans]
MSERISAAAMRKFLGLYLVIGSVDCRQEPLQVAEEALAGGATMIQFREKGPGALTGEPKLRLAEKLQAVCRRAGVPFIVNDDVELALAIDADGIHVGQEDESASQVRERVEGRILGVSAHTVEEAQLAIYSGGDYLGIGPVYPTASKADAREPQGPSFIRRLRECGIREPLVAIGGITAARAGEVIRAGADGIAVISAVTQAADVRKAVEELHAAVAFGRG